VKLVLAEKMWNAIRNEERTDQPVRSALLADGLAAGFLEGARSGHSGSDLYRRIDLLTEMASFHDPEISLTGATALYTGIIEPLCDSFASAQIEVCTRVLARVISHVRQDPRGAAMNAILVRHGLTGEDELVARHTRLAARRERIGDRPQTIVILSRVTVGADVAITSVLLNRLAQRFPGARLLLVAPPKQAEIFGGLANIEIIPLDYPRSGPLFGRLAAWPRLVELVGQLTSGANDGDVLLFDPDSRLSQLGLLPTTPEQHTYYFYSRMEPPTDKGQTLSELANSWLDLVCGEAEAAYPQLWLPSHFQQLALSLRRRLNAKGCRCLLTINFGVGNNEKKRISAQFEEDLLLALLRQTQKTIILLDSGTGAEGRCRTEKLLAAASRQGLATVSLAEQNLPSFSVPFDHGLIGFSGSLGSLAAIIGCSELFIGYDSACQHLASAQARPTIIIFAGAPSSRFIERWRPMRREGVVTVPVMEAQSLSIAAQESVREAVLAAIRKLLPAGWR